MWIDDFERLPDLFRKPNIKKYYELMYKGYDDLDNLLKDVKTSRDIDQAYGKTLDYIGKNVLEPRGVKNDDVYRLYIKTKVIANWSKGDIPTMNQVSQTLFGKDFINLKETWSDPIYGEDIAGIVLKLRPSELSQVPSMMELVKAGGVKMYYEAVLPNESIIIEENQFIRKAKYKLSGRTKTESKKVNSNSEEILISDNYFKNIIKYEKSGRVKTKSVESGVSHENLSLNEKNHMGRVKYLKTGKAICGGGRL